MSIRLFLTGFVIAAFSSVGFAESPPSWNQWRGPNRDGIVAGNDWPNTLDEDTLKRQWRIELPPSYSGPIVSENTIFTTATLDKKSEVVYAFDRKSGEELWKQDWPGAMTVPFFAASNGSWIRATPAFDGKRLIVAGMRDVLVCLDAKSGQIVWRKDFVDELKTPVPAFGFASSPLVDGKAVYAQAGASFLKVDIATGKIIWRTLEDGGGMFGSAFSSPVVATLADTRQLVVQTRLNLAGVNPADGDVLWKQPIPNFRGMNILTPIPYGNSVFTSSYRNKAWLFDVSQSENKFAIKQDWESNTQAYMSTPVLIDDHVYMHLQNQRFACIDLRTGERKWTSKPYGKYCSLVAQGKKILALDNRGILLLLKASPEKFELISERKISDEETWAHIAISGDEIFIREQKGLSAFRWKKAAKLPKL